MRLEAVSNVKTAPFERQRVLAATVLGYTRESAALLGVTLYSLAPREANGTLLA
jgi:hypothetical protein